MAQTLNNYSISQGWVSLNTLSSIPVGEEMIITNKGVEWVLLAEGTEPAIDSKDGVLLTSVSTEDSSKGVVKGSLEIWAKSTDATNNAIVNIQEI